MLTTHGYTLFLQSRLYWFSNMKKARELSTVYQGQEIYLSKRIGGHIQFQILDLILKQRKTKIQILILT